MKRAALYLRVSTLDQHPQNQLHDLQQLAQQRGWEIVHEYRDQGISGTRVRRPALDELLGDAHQGKFEIVAVWACDRLARSVRHFLEVLDQLTHDNVEFVSFREQLDTGGPLGRALVTFIAAMAELERNLIIERVRAGMRRAKLEGQHIGRRPTQVDRASVLRHRIHGHSLTEIAKAHGISRALVCKILNQEKRHGHEGCPQTPSQPDENAPPEMAA
jgi:DNA invertase Pin-like site-specific DNA recombinase